MAALNTPSSVRDAASMCELFQATVAARPDTIALRTPDDGVRLTWREYGERVRRIGRGLAALGVGQSDRVALMMTNRPEFHLLDAAVFHLGGTPFSIYNTSAPGQIEYLFANAQNRVVVCERQFLPAVVEAARDSAVETIVCVDGEQPGVLSLAELEASGDPGFDFDAAWQAVKPDDVLTLIYTSGTTGPPKGVELTHRNLLAASAAGLEVTGPLDGGRAPGRGGAADARGRRLRHVGRVRAAGAADRRGAREPRGRAGRHRRPDAYEPP